MSSHTITHVCGHPEQHLLRGGRQEQEHQAIALGNKPCTACRRAARERRQREAAAWARAQGLPELDGTPRQAAAAERIRRDTLTCSALRGAARNAAAILRGSERERAALPAPLRRLLKHPEASAALQDLARYTEEVIRGLQAETSAAWWEARPRGLAWIQAENKIHRRMASLRGVLLTAV